MLVGRILSPLQTEDVHERVEDVCGHYEIMEPDEWAEVKDDTIEDVADAPEEVPAETPSENEGEA